MTLRRRTVLMLSTAAGAAAAVAILTVRSQMQSAAQREAAERDYLAGHLAVVDGWIVAASEAERAGPAQAQPEPALR